MRLGPRLAQARSLGERPQFSKPQGMGQAVPPLPCMTFWKSAMLLCGVNLHQKRPAFQTSMSHALPIPFMDSLPFHALPKASPAGRPRIPLGVRIDAIALGPRDLLVALVPGLRRAAGRLHHLLRLLGPIVLEASWRHLVEGEEVEVAGRLIDARLGALELLKSLDKASI